MFETGTCCDIAGQNLTGVDISGSYVAVVLLELYPECYLLCICKMYMLLSMGQVRPSQLC